MKMNVYDQDGLGSNDDLVVEYTVHFSGREIGQIDKKCKINGYIEGNDDATAELYVKFKLNRIDGDSGTSGSFFKYNFGIN